ncbi:hypothetical protein PSHT_13928 [Puccinia striiformis]|uniref:Tet-like 2OG-Fe(II) oxygenase domain-containing protein n=1 Tax=Puccinia striiformis TaxID=27350 RepID=A0A2S4UMT0_9BASI|nr:hypothetical protein PSHT_13928 [Puccinia striiformis]
MASNNIASNNIILNNIASNDITSNDIASNDRCWKQYRFKRLMFGNDIASNDRCWKRYRFERLIRSNPLLVATSSRQSLKAPYSGSILPPCCYLLATKLKPSYSGSTLYPCCYSRKNYKRKKHSEWKITKLQRERIQNFNTCIASKKNPNEKILWSYRSHHELHLYPKIHEQFHHPENTQPARRPTPEEIKWANDLVNTKDFFTLYTHGKVVVMDFHKRDQIIAVMEFIKIEDLSPTEKENLNFLSSFLHSAKKYVNPVSSPARSWGGRMWALGWRKAMVTAQLIGRYIFQSAVDKNKEDYDNLMKTSDRASNILGNMFKSMADIPYEQNRDLMKKNNIPSFAHLSFNDPLSEGDCSPHLTYTSDGFFNNPHEDDQDISVFAFALFLPHDKVKGTLADPTTGYNVTGGPFVVPDYRFGIDFTKQKGVVKLLWASKKIQHCTLPPVENNLYTCLAMSLQINIRTSKTCEKIQDGSIYNTKANKGKEMHLADHNYYLNKN